MLGRGCCSGFALVVDSGGSSLVACMAFSLGWSLLFQSRALEHTGFHGGGMWAQELVAHGLGYSRACGIFQNQELNPGPLHWQADSLPLSHQGCPPPDTFKIFICLSVSLPCIQMVQIFICMTYFGFVVLHLGNLVSHQFYTVLSH